MLIILGRKPEIIGKHGKREKSCIVGQEVEISWRFRSTDELRVTWLFNGHVLSQFDRIELRQEDDEYTLLIRNFQASDTGIYTIRATNDHGNVEAETKLLVFDTRPIIISDSISSISVIIGQAIYFQLAVCSYGPINIIWMRVSKD